MAYKELVAARKYPKRISARYKQLDGLRAALRGNLFDVLQYSFEQEEDGPGNDIEVEKRRPSVYYNMYKMLVDETSSLTFGEAHAPSLRVDMDASDDPENAAAVHTALEGLVEALKLESLMMKAMNLGAPGSLLIILRRLGDGTPWVELVEGQYCKPYFDPDDPRILAKAEQIYPVSAEELDLAGYGDHYEEGIYWIRNTYDIDGKTASLPMKNVDYERLGDKDETGKKITWKYDEERSYDNPFDFAPLIWVKNLDITVGVDGAPTVPVEVIDISIAISYALSMTTRGYKYTADPIMMVKAGQLRTTIPLAGSVEASGPYTRSPSKRMMLSADGDAKMLEISAAGLKASDEHVKVLREYGLELAAGMKSESRDSGGMQSGKAFDALYYALIWLTEKFRGTYGNGAYLSLIRMILRGIEDGILIVNDVDTSVLSSDMRLRNAWPEWSVPHGGDLQAELNGLAMAVGSTPTHPVPIMTVDMAAAKAASAVGYGDQNRAAAQVLRAHQDNPPMSERESMTMTFDHEKEMEETKAKATVDAAKARPKPSPSA